MFELARRGIFVSAAFGLIVTASRIASAATGPCDIYLAAGTPCVAAHSTVRALYGAYNGPLYQVKRTSDNVTQDIKPIAPGGPADGDAQDKFCTSECVVTMVYDQSGKGNFLESQAYGPTVAGNDNPTIANTENF